MKGSGCPILRERFVILFTSQTVFLFSVSRPLARPVNSRADVLLMAVTLYKNLIYIAVFVENYAGVL